MLVILGLAPGMHEVLENLVHLTHNGHLAHSEIHEAVAGAEDCRPDAEHHCTPLSHRCSCCVSLVGLSSPPEILALPLLCGTDIAYHGCTGTGPTVRFLDPPYRPPIA